MSAPKIERPEYRLALLRATARARAILTEDSDWRAWEQEMREDVEQDAIRYMEGER